MCSAQVREGKEAEAKLQQQVEELRAEAAALTKKLGQRDSGAAQVIGQLARYAGRSGRQHLTLSRLLWPLLLVGDGELLVIYWMSCL